MSLLIDGAPKTICINNTEYRINSDFRVSIAYETLVLDREKSPAEKLNEVLGLYFPLIPDDIEKAMEAIFWFYRCGKAAAAVKGYGKGSSERIYSFEHDGEYIYAAFLGQYSIDLTNVEYLHWWKFKALFEGLKEDCRLCRIMGYRAMEIPPDMESSRKDFYRKMKELYRLPLPKNEEEKLDAIEEALLNGGDLTGIL